MKGPASVVINRVRDCLVGPTRVLLSAFRGTIRTMYSAAFQKTNAGIH